MLTEHSCKTILVTGAAGFIGFHLSLRLLKEGHQVIGFDNLNSYYDVSLKQQRLDLLTQHPLFRFIRGELAESREVIAVFEQYQPSLVIHLAAQAGVRYSIEHPKSYIESNIVGFFHILEGCRRFPPEQLLYASSSSVYGNQSKVPFAVDDPVDTPVSLYAATKKSNELMAYTYSHLFQIPMTGLRFFTVYGPYGRPDMAYFDFVRKIKANETIRIFNYGDLYRDFTYVDDIIEGICLILKRRDHYNQLTVPHKIYNIGNHQPQCLMKFISILEQLLGKEAKKEYLPMQPGDVYQTYADISELTRDFQFHPQTSLETGLAQFVQWYEQYDQQAGEQKLLVKG